MTITKLATIVKETKYRLLYSCLFTLLPFTTMAQDMRIIKGDCMPEFTKDGALARGTQRRLPTPNTEWDSTRTYRQLVILFSFSDKDFSMDNAQAAYNAIFNEKGYNGSYQRNGAGCVADYFRDQSNGLFNLQFDVFGPYKVDTLAQPVNNPNASTKNYGRDQMQRATRLFLAEHPDLDFSVYDWNGNGKVNQVIYVCAGYGGNQSSTKCYGYIWPNTSSFGTISTPDGHTISDYTISCELWSNDTSFGIGTICHEYTHSLGLPDIYPTNGWTYSAVDEWDLMDGGNFTNYGWCPPNYTPLEKMLMGWLKPTELTEPTTVRDLKPAAEGGNVYMVRHTANEYLLLENRQWRGWDYGVPGKGLVIYHVNYIPSRWSNNTVNNTQNQFNFDILHADMLDYSQWEAEVQARGITSQNGTYQHTPRLNRWMLSGSPYPYETEDSINDALTDESSPATQMYNQNEQASKLLSKPITNIKMSADGLVTFDFMGGTSTAIHSQAATSDQHLSGLYDLSGRRYATRNGKGIYIERKTDGTIRKLLK